MINEIKAVLEKHKDHIPVVATAELLAVLDVAEEKAKHTYENCHNLTCRRKCQKDGYNMAIDDFAEKLKAELSQQIFSDEEKFKYARKEQEAICAQNAAWKVAIRLADYVAEQLKEE